MAAPSSAQSNTDDRHLTGVLERVIYLNEENHYTIGELRPEKGTRTVTIVGALPEVQCSETLELHGDWTEHPQHGAQFKVKDFRATLPSSVYGIRKYLGSGLISGIGPSYAEKIVNAFGADTLRVIEEDSGRLREVSGIGKKRAGEIKEAWDSQRALREVLMFLQTYGATVSQCSRIVHRYGPEAIRILKEDPYQVAREVHGIGFKTADRLAINLGFANDAPARLEAGVLHVLKELEGNGHTGYQPNDLEEATTTLLETTKEGVANAIERLSSDGSLIAAESSPLLQLPTTARAESILAESLLLNHAQPSKLPPIKIDLAVKWAQDKAGFEFAPEQCAAVAQALASKTSILTGGPGTGKTTILRALVDILRAKKVRIVLAAPTGRAAQRMAQSARHNASTIHRLLKFDPAGGGFVHNRDRPLNADFFIVDEASMLDNALASSLIRAIPAQAHILFVGDADQLPSVGAGNVLGDLITSKVFPVTRLQKIFRQGAGSAVVRVAHSVLSNEAQAPYVIDEIKDFDPLHDVCFIRRLTPEACVATVAELATEHFPRWYPKVNPVMGTQVLVPLHRGAAGISQFNKTLQTSFNRSQEKVTFGEIAFHLGDKVIQMKNNYDKGIFNGDLGRISHLNTVAGTVAVDFEGTSVDLERSELSDLSLAYAISIHKSQGSEFPIVVLPLLKQHFLLLQRNLLYTAITRGKRKVFIVGDPSAYAMAVRNTEAAIRRTDLVRKVQIQS
jgi:exodeoxyribonuclease V alpha subunit